MQPELRRAPRSIGRALRSATCLLALAAGGCAGLARDPEPRTLDVASLLTGHFTSAAQAKADPEFFEVHLHMAPIWTDRTDGPWLYVEQAMATAPDKPYRQRIYRLVERSTAERTCVESQVFELPNAADRVGAWADPARFARDTPEALVAREGCSIELSPAADGSWSGATIGSNCASSLRGASYATSEVWLTRAALRTWDRGYDATDAQVWGAKKGPYVFDRVGE